MTTYTEYQPARSKSSITTIPTDLVIVGLWSLMGLCVSAAFLLAGFDFSSLAG